MTTRRLCLSPHHRGPRWCLSVYFYAREKHPDGTAKRLQSWCATCQRIGSRIRNGIRRRGRPYEQRKPSKLGLKTDADGYIVQTDAEREVYREYRRSLYHGRSPERREADREYKRIWAEAQRRKQGVPVRSDLIEKRVLADGPHGKRLDAEPMSRWVNKILREYPDALTLAEACGVDEATIRRLRDREVSVITESLADRMLIREGSTDLWSVYPHLYGD